MQIIAQGCNFCKIGDARRFPLPATEAPPRLRSRRATVPPALAWPTVARLSKADTKAAALRQPAETPS